MKQKKVNWKAKMDWEELDFNDLDLAPKEKIVSKSSKNKQLPKNKKRKHEQED